MTDIIKQDGGALATVAMPQGMGKIEGETSQDTTIPLAHLYQDTSAERKIFGQGYQAGDLVNIVTMQPLVSRRFCVISGYIDYKDERSDAAIHVSRNAADWIDEDHQFIDRGDGKKPHPYIAKRMNYLVLFEGEDWPVVLRFKKTSLQAGRNLNSMVKMQQAKKVFGLFEYGTKEGQSDQGAYVVPTIKLCGQAPPEMTAKAVTIFNALNGRDVQVADDAKIEGDEAPF